MAWYYSKETFISETFSLVDEYVSCTGSIFIYLEKNDCTFILHFVFIWSICSLHLEEFSLFKIHARVCSSEGSSRVVPWVCSRGPGQSGQATDTSLAPWTASATLEAACSVKPPLVSPQGRAFREGRGTMLFWVCFHTCLYFWSSVLSVLIGSVLLVFPCLSP